jgi:hypothetical protein
MEQVKIAAPVAPWLGGKKRLYRGGDAFEAKLNMSLNTGSVIGVPNRMTMEEFLEAQRKAGLYDSPTRLNASQAGAPLRRF